MVHDENGDAVFKGQKIMIELGITGPEGHALSRPPVFEGEATARAIRFVHMPLCVVHVMSVDAMDEIAKVRKSGQKVIGGPVVSGVVLDDHWLGDIYCGTFPCKSGDTSAARLSSPKILLVDTNVVLHQIDMLENLWLGTRKDLFTTESELSAVIQPREFYVFSSRVHK